MDQPKNNFQYFVHGLSTTLVAALAALLVAALVVVGVVVYTIHGSSLSFGRKDVTTFSPSQLQSLRQIGQWEFLSVADEELIDTVSYGFFGDHHLARIYYGTLRLGIDLSCVEPGWIAVSGDSVSVELPPVTLLDEHFIDEALTRSFYESGSWSHADREQLYQRAVVAMKQRSLHPDNIKAAEQNARSQLSSLFRTMGYKRVGIVFRE